MTADVKPISAAHETDRVRGGSVVLGVSALVAILIAIYALVWLLLPGTPPALPDGNPLANAPAAADWGDAGVEQLRRLREREDANLHSWQWIDDRHSARRIPIESAMELLAKQARAREGGTP